MNINLYDSNSHIRRLIEGDASGLPLRTLLTQVNNSASVEVFVWDGAGGNERRRKLFPGYKANRTPPAEDIFATMNLFKQVLRHTKAIQITVPTYEGDDVLAYMAQAYASRATISIRSSDRDLLALCTLPGVRLVDVPAPKVPPELIRLYKATRGDPSDGIPGIKGFGEVAWERCDKEALLNWYEGTTISDSGFDIVTHGAVDKIANYHFGIPMCCASWLKENSQLARTFYHIVGFMPPTDAEVAAGTIVGKRDDAATANIMGRFML